MITLDAKTVADALPCLQLVETLRAAFARDTTVPPRAHHEVPVPGGTAGTLLLMPAWSEQYVGVKIIAVFPDNTFRGIPAVSGSYLVMDATSGRPVAVMDGTELTLHRTAAASALASSYLSRDNSTHLLMVGTGNLAPYLIRAHAAVRPLTAVTVWGRRTEAAEKIANDFGNETFGVEVAESLETAVRSADIISCATLSSEPLIRGGWLLPGQHVDLVGAFTPTMTEADLAALQKSEIYVDTRKGAFAEAGEIVQAIALGSLDQSDIRGSLRELVTGVVSGRSNAEEITLFKSVGTALEDLAAAEQVIAEQGKQGMAGTIEPGSNG